MGVVDARDADDQGGILGLASSLASLGRVVGPAWGGFLYDRYGMRTPYAAAKWAVIGLTKSVAIEVGPYGVRCNAICPGSVAGARIDSVIAAEAQQRGVEPAVVAAEYVQGQSIKRFVEPSEIADLCLFLASPASSMISGQAIGIDGHTETYHL